MNIKDKAVNAFIENLNHPKKELIETLRTLVLATSFELSENIKWNGPNYVFKDTDCISMKINPPTKIQLIFHRGAKKQALPKNKLIDLDEQLLDWRTTDRAVATFKTVEELNLNSVELKAIIEAWLKNLK